MSRLPGSEPTENRDNHPDLVQLVNNLIASLKKDQFFKTLLGYSESAEQSLTLRLLENLKIIINNELVSQFLIRHLPTDDLNNHIALLYLLTDFTSEELQPLLNRTILRRIILLALEKNDYQLISRLPEIDRNLNILFKIFGQIELDSLIQPDNINAIIFDIVTKSNPENLAFLAERIPSQSLRRSIYDLSFQELLKSASPQNLELLHKLIIDLFIRKPSDDEDVFIMLIILAIHADYNNLKILKDSNLLTEEGLKNYANQNNLIDFLTHTNPFNLELLKEHGLLLEHNDLVFLISNSPDLMIYSNPDALELLLKNKILNRENFQELFKDTIIESALLQYGKPENFAFLIEKGLINTETFGQLVKLATFYHLVNIPTANLQDFLEKKANMLTPEKLVNLLKGLKVPPDDQPEVILEYLDPDTYSAILSRLPESESSQN